MNTSVNADAMLDVLARMSGTGGEFGGFLSNHGPMAADAMIRLGGADRVDAWARMYAVVLEPAPPATGTDLSGDHWRESLGIGSTEGDWFGMFRRAITESGWPAVVEVWWPRLLPGAAASAAHGLIRTAHAIRNLADGHEGELLHDELAAGLALWASRYVTLPGAPRLSGDSSLDAAIEGLPRLDPRTPSRGPGLVGRLAALHGLDGFADALDRWAPTGTVESGLDELISGAARLVLIRSDNPIAYCHVVTVPAAARAVLDHVPDYAR